MQVFISHLLSSDMQLAHNWSLCCVPFVKYFLCILASNKHKSYFHAYQKQCSILAHSTWKRILLYNQNAKSFSFFKIYIYCLTVKHLTSGLKCWNKMCIDIHLNMLNFIHYFHRLNVNILNLLLLHQILIVIFQLMNDYFESSNDTAVCQLSLRSSICAVIWVFYCILCYYL